LGGKNRSIWVKDSRDNRHFDSPVASGFRQRSRAGNTPADHHAGCRNERAGAADLPVGRFQLRGLWLQFMAVGSSEDEGQQLTNMPAGYTGATSAARLFTFLSISDAHITWIRRIFGTISSKMA
jgi:hypothetical protein